MNTRYILHLFFLAVILTNCAQKDSTVVDTNSTSSTTQPSPSTVQEGKLLEVEPIDQIEKDLESSLEKEVSRIEQLDSIKSKDQKDFDPIEEEMEEESDM